ncbi:MAG TPA: hypothetical protein VHW23_32085 [Kofleriaceae bacterium]|jgi:hypothetical protein|nr:hypothetical protein [Kofleriaceae bacterium]
MSDDLDEIDAALRRAMAALDGETPPGYFDALPARTLARLDDPAIGERTDEPGVRPLRVAQDRPSDEGEDDDDDDGAMFASQVIALADLSEPEGNVVALPHADRALTGAVAPVASMATAPDAQRLGSLRTAPVPSRGGAAGPVEAPAGRRRRRGVRAAVVGIGLAAAGAAIYLVAGHRSMDSAPTASEGSSTTTVAASGAASAGSGSAGSAPGSGFDASGVAGAGSAIAGSGAAQARGTGAGPDEIGKFAGSKSDRPDNAKLPSKTGQKLRVKVEPEGKIAAPAPDAGLSKKRKPSKAAAGRTSLSSDDLERAMGAVAGRARACLAGTTATASLRLTVAPSGQIAQVAVTGPLAGTPAGACVERAVRTATFPPWDGVAQSFDYSYPD